MTKLEMLQDISAAIVVRPARYTGLGRDLFTMFQEYGLVRLVVPDGDHYVLSDEGRLELTGLKRRLDGNCAWWCLCGTPLNAGDIVLATNRSTGMPNGGEAYTCDCGVTWTYHPPPGDGTPDYVTSSRGNS